MGPPPGIEVWERVVQDISNPPGRRRWRRWRYALQAIFRSPLGQSAIALAALLVLLVQPTNYLFDQATGNEASPRNVVEVIEVREVSTGRERPVAHGEATYRQLLALDAATEIPPPPTPPIVLDPTYLGGIQP